MLSLLSICATLCGGAPGEELRDRLSFGERRLAFEERNFAASVPVSKLVSWRLVDEPCLLRAFVEHEVRVVRLSWDSPVPMCELCEAMRRELPAVRARLETNTLTDEDRKWIRSHGGGPIGLVALALGERVYLYSHGHSQLTCGFDLTTSLPDDAALKAEVLRTQGRWRALKR
jgi:hypothetical protein